MEASLFLALNSGSSSLKFAVYRSKDKLLSGMVDRISEQKAMFLTTNHQDDQHAEEECIATDHAEAADRILAYIEKQLEGEVLSGIGHRIVHGGEKYTEPVVLDQAVLEELFQLVPFAPEHLPHEIGIIEFMRKRLPSAVHVACFDTAFHAHMPQVAQMIPLPKNYRDNGVRRYGFHGISYAYVLEELERLAPQEAKGNVIMAHLGHGASMAAVQGGKCMDTTMGFTPASGLVMGTRIGDMDPGVAWYLLTTGGMNAEDMYALLNKESGLLGLSGVSGDMRDLLEVEGKNPEAAAAVELFCYRIRQMIGAYAATLGGCDSIIFTGGMGESASAVRSRACANLDILGIDIDEEKNAQHAQIISSQKSSVTVRIISTDEEQMIARWTSRLAS